MRSGQRALCFALLFSHGDHPRCVHVVLAKKRSPASKSLYGQFSIAFTSLAYVRTVLYMRSLIYSTVWPIQLLSALLPSQHDVMAAVGLLRSVQTQTRPRLETWYVTIAGPTSRKVPVSLSWCIFLSFSVLLVADFTSMQLHVLYICPFSVIFGKYLSFT